MIMLLACGRCAKKIIQGQFEFLNMKSYGFFNINQFQVMRIKDSIKSLKSEYFLRYSIFYLNTF